MKYFYKFSICALPKLPNGSHGHWADVNKKRKLWHSWVESQVIFMKPKEPLKAVKLTFARVSTTPCDFDNMVYSFKPVVDGLVNSKIIHDDDYETILERHYHFIKCKTRKEHRIEVTIEEI